MSDSKRTSGKVSETTETSETTSIIETAGAEAPPPGGHTTTHWLVAGSTVIAIAFVVTLWTIKGGRLDSFGFSNIAVVEVAAPVATAPALTASTPVVAPVTAPLSIPATTTAAQPSVPTAVVPVAIAPNGMPLFSTPTYDHDARPSLLPTVGPGNGHFHQPARLSAHHEPDDDELDAGMGPVPANHRIRHCRR